MNYGRITREQAINEVGIDAVMDVELENVEFTNRVTEGTEDAGTTEFSAISPVAGDYDSLVMYVFVDDDKLAGIDELDDLDWDTIISETAEFEQI